MDQVLEELPEEIAALVHQHEQEKIVKREEFSQMVAKKRDEAVTGRLSSGIETQWVEDDEHYNGIDNANRGSTGMMKPSHPSAGFAPTRKAQDGRSSVFLNITRPYVDAIVARTCDILLPTDDKNWGIEPTPIPELLKALHDQSPIDPDMGTNVPDMGPAPVQPGVPPPQTPAITAGSPPQAAPVPPAPAPTVADMARQELDKASDAADKASKQIDDWLAEAGYNAENRKVIFDAAKLGVGVIKGPCPKKRKSTAVSKAPEGIKIEMSMEIKPTSVRVDPWNFFPDPSCGEDIHSGNHCFERDYLTAKSLRELKGLPGYMGAEIDQVLEEGPRGKDSGVTSGNPNVNRLSDKELFEVWYGYMSVGKQDLEAMGVDVKDIKFDSIYAIVTMVNNTVIKAAVNPLDSGDFPYDVMAWQRVAGQWAGIGVSRQIRSPQQMLNAANRNMMDNAGLSGGPILIIRQNMITPADGDWTLRPRKIFYATADADVRTVQDAIFPINIPSMQLELMNIIQFAMKTAELVTGFPLMMQGQASQSTPDTYGGQILATNNASTVLRHVARTYDDSITTPHIGRYYEYLLMYGEDESMKGDFTVVARGSTTLVEKEIQAQEMLQLMQMSGNPGYGLDPKKLIAEWFKSRRFDPRKFQYSEQEMAKIQQQPQPAAPAIEVAKIRAESAKEVATIREQGTVQAINAEAKLEIDAQAQGHLTPQMASAQARISEATIRANSEQEKEKSRSATELAYVQSEAQMARDNAAARMQELALKREIALLNYANKNDLQLNQVKADLAKTAMQEETKRQLAGVEHQVKQNAESDKRGHDMTKHITNVQSNQDTAALARAHADDQQSKKHAHEIEVEKVKLANAAKMAQDVPGKKF